MDNDNNLVQYQILKKMDGEIKCCIVSKLNYKLNYDDILCLWNNFIEKHYYNNNNNGIIFDKNSKADQMSIIVSLNAYKFSSLLNLHL